MTSAPPTRGDDIRASFLRFFEGRGHLLMPSASLIPSGDPTLLLTSAGMVPFKPYYAGDEEPPRRRMVSCQKCFRTTDIDSVGDLTHHTFFEMLGNFSIGDYFKRDAIRWAWEYVTGVLRIPGDRLWITVHETDDEAEAIWRDEIGVPIECIRRLGDADNFWGPAGDEGACGPSSEIHYDRGESLGPGKRPGDETNRFVEIWNLVFVQFYQHKDKTRVLLPAPSIDTGMGLERLTAIMQGVGSAYETDLLRPIVATAERITSKAYGHDESTDFALRVMAEHARSAVFLISDGVVPSNEGRGYVLRRVIRRAIRFAHKIGVDEPFLARMAEAVIERMRWLYPELELRKRFVLRTLESEEDRFFRTVSAGLAQLNGLTGTQGLLSGQDAFFLYDTYGFPLEMTEEIARERGLRVDVDGFAREMAAQRERGRAATRFGADRDAHRTYGALAGEGTTFVGYDALEADTVVVGILKEGRAADHAALGDEIELILRETPFYAEGGGQVGDTGTVRGPSGVVQVRDTQRPVGGVLVHYGTVTEGSIAVGERTRATVDQERRADIMRNHTATHMLHAALRNVLGTHVRQAGSLVAPERLRFDFSHVAPLTPIELQTVQQMVNEAIRKNLVCLKSEGSYRDVTAQGAVAFFGERYPERVRTLRIGEDDPFSFEVCGGTHIDRTGQIGLFRIVSEAGIGTGLRRIEAVTGRVAETWLSERVAVLDAISAKLHVPPGDLPQRIDALLAELESARKLSAQMQREAGRSEAETLLSQAVDVDGFRLVAARTGATDADSMREIGDWLRDKLGTGIVVLGAIVQGKPSVLAMVTDDLVSKGYNAREIVSVAGPRMDGGGGGKPNLAQAGGKDSGKLDDAIKAAVEMIRKRGN